VTRGSLDGAPSVAMKRSGRCLRRIGWPLALVAGLGGCDSMRTTDDRLTFSGRVIGAQLVPKGGSAIKGRVIFERRQGGVTMMAQVHGALTGVYRVAIHANGNCSSPNAFSAGPPWAPPGRAVEAWTGTTDNAGMMLLTVRIDGVVIDGPDGIMGRSVVVHYGALGPLDTQPGARNERVACGVIGTISSPEF
jgi:Cu-Zn family superoxide dismutase